MTGAATQTGLRASAEDLDFIERLRRGDEHAFEVLVDRYYGAMLRIAQGYVSNRAVAEEAVQEAWLAVMGGIDRFEGRSSLKTWIFRILHNIAVTRAEREARTLPFSALAAEDESEPVVDSARFRSAGTPFAGHWLAYPEDWQSLPEEVLVARETMGVIEEAVAQLPPAQRLVISLRDIEGWSATEVCETLEISEGNERVLLHRARSRVRRALELHLDS